MDIKNQAKTMFGADSYDANRNKYYLIRNHCHSTIRYAQRHQIHKFVKNKDQVPKHYEVLKLWVRLKLKKVKLMT